MSTGRSEPSQVAAEGLPSEFPPLRGAEPVKDAVLRLCLLLGPALVGVIAATVAIPVFALSQQRPGVDQVDSELGVERRFRRRHVERSPVRLRQARLLAERDRIREPAGVGHEPGSGLRLAARPEVGDAPADDRRRRRPSRDRPTGTGSCGSRTASRTLSPRSTRRRTAASRLRRSTSGTARPASPMGSDPCGSRTPSTGQSRVSIRSAA